MVTWGSTPQRKVEAGATDISSDVTSVTVHRPENGISRTIFTANDYDGKNYIAYLNAFTVIKVSLRYASGAWTQVFEGKAERLGPSLDTDQTVDVLAYGYGRALRNTHCDSNYGLESEDPTLDTPHEIWDDLIANQINKSFGGVATQYAITDAKVAPCANPVLNFMEGGYRSNLNVINDVLMAYQGYQDGSAGMHWFVDESKNLFINTIGAHENNATGWPTWWRTNQAGSTLVEGTDFHTSTFHKNVTPNHFANKIVLYCDLRKPGTDIWSEDSGPDWGSYNLTTSDYDNTEYIVGSHSRRLVTNGPALGFCWYPGESLLTGDAAAGQKVVAVTSVTGVPFRVGDTVKLWDNTPTTETATIASIAALNLTMVDNLANAYQVADAATCRKMANWDFTKAGSQESTPTLNFYFWWDADSSAAAVRLPKTDYTNDYYEVLFATWWTDPKEEWIHRSIPVGPYWKTKDEQRRYRWDETNLGAGSWSEINEVVFGLQRVGEANATMYIDDLHFAGKIIREAYNSTNIAANAEVQKILRYDVAVDDVLKASDDRGTAAQLAYGELLTRQDITTTVGVFVTPLAEDALPGQLIHIHSDYTGAVYRIDADFRVKEVIHNVIEGVPATTTWDVTSDVLNTFVPGFNDALTTYYRMMHTDPEMMNLRTTGLDPYVDRLSKDYP